ncbi:hypothetical protein E7T09_16145 [Deinococcus sp. KSM4-11]|uniref:hypothetical protein n=1 Tax=Deinococcus sp. KSM4-11 TaxID=2568654 RepID=UPI0010A36B1F|nr:hypothetical protein [Deinococcus sp. KSM4-11]THF85490.1 hypothetical protein E7T09_16145 [Deinococcus sp. KSM4-11]
MKATQQEVQVTLTGTGQPHMLLLDGRALPIREVIDRWRYGGRWWLGEVPRECFLIQAGSLTAELHHAAPPDGRWWLARVQD